MNIGKAIADYENQISLNLAKTTARTYRNGLNHFRAYLEEHDLTANSPIEGLTPEHFINFPAWLAGKTFQKSTAKVYSTSVKTLFDNLVIRGLLKPDHVETLRMGMAFKAIMRRHEARLVRFPKEGEAEKMLETVQEINQPSPRRERDIALIAFLYSSGCRNSEVANLMINEIDMPGRSAIVTGKGDKQRRVYFDTFTFEALKRYWVARGYDYLTSPAFCRHDRGTGRRIRKLTPTSIRKIVAQVVMVAGIEKGKFSPHYFRHAFAINVLQATHNLAVVQDLLGHANTNSTRVYAKIYPDDLRDAHRKIYD